ncbi:MAG: hypothetical protein ACO3R5_11325 [Pseudohongiellaceae bacterium]
MKHAFLIAPMVAALLFAGPQAWQQIQSPPPGYIPVVYEALLLISGYLAAAAVNTIVIVPVCLLVRLKTLNLVAGLALALLVALIVTTIAYAYEIFGYQSSILHPEYLYPLFLPLLVLTVLSFWFVTRPVTAASPPPEQADSEEASVQDTPQ